MGIRSRLPDVRIPWVSITDLLLADVDKYEEFIAVLDSESDIKYTYGEVRNHTRSIGSALTRNGFQKGDVLCICCPNLPEFPLVLLGTLAVGGIITTANPQFTAEEIEKQIKLAQVQYMVTVPECAEKTVRVAAATGIKAVYVLGSAQGCSPFTELLNDDGSAFPDDVNISPQDVAFLPFSSGTTGPPKCVMLTHYNIVANLLQMR
ncbi:4-coumarate--CoA ligase 2-like [Lingula anatina]|uniref:4-coumarate--CoA ligase 2-like n=1 Tax=Lingula anatina TaxID=7574 RepID=A0A1S3IC43_LINAN|nr:4-coumarate--CoA ligase 2-like [Lingula anatina]|eukprot:XP_013395812.1 4-coumarate--CoA ligase 2-like [Lingula anatina]